MQSKHVNRIRGIFGSVAGNADTYFTLLTAVDAPDYDIETDLGGVNIAQCETGSHISLIKINYQLKMPSGSHAEIALFKDPDANLTTNYTMANLWDSDFSTTIGQVKKSTMFYKLHVISSGSDVQRGHFFIKRAALMRNGFMRENDQIRILVTTGGSASSHQLYLTGKIVTRK